MRVAPWNQYQLVDKEFDPDIQLASGKNELVCGCTFFVCFNRPSARLENPCNLKVGPVLNQETLPEPAVFCENKDRPRSDNGDGDDSSVSKIINRKSSLKKPIDLSVAATDGVGGCTKDHTAFCETNYNSACQIERRKVQWTDTSGGELFHVREFEMSRGSEIIRLLFLDGTLYFVWLANLIEHDNKLVVENAENLKLKRMIEFEEGKGMKSGPLYYFTLGKKGYNMTSLEDFLPDQRVTPNVSSFLEEGNFESIQVDPVSCRVPIATVNVHVGALVALLSSSLLDHISSGKS
ncbi:hypothetical protein F511_11364 [Dorcoceras hygrometricum]|uniref:Uncharacterized protein n=1 Tax=Dorcoceras hygrometricum TaxID=472368 RepID=A0A2Z7AC89_9LAMI|nr:hypothetical protein F511_11364 [Dorcoceras hygrometricum]